MTQELSSFLRRDTICASGSFVLITEVDLIDAGFLVSHLMADQLRIGNRVCLITTSRTSQHYHQVCSKLGINLKSYEDKKQFIMLELLKSEYEKLKNSSARADDGQQTSTDHGSQVELRTVYLKLKDEMAAFLGQVAQPHLILIDDLSVWLNIGVAAVPEIVAFVQYCRTLITSNSPHGCLATVTYWDSTEEDNDHTTLGRLLMHSCDLSIQVAPLKSGYSRDIHGELTLLWKNKIMRLEPSTTGQTKLQFKVEDKRVMVFPPGTSSAVL